MKLGTAIKILTQLKIQDYPLEGRPSHEAIKLGIEALKLEQEARADLNPGEYDLLPGETKEV